MLQVNNIKLSTTTLNLLKDQCLLETNFEGDILLTKYQNNRLKHVQIFEYNINKNYIVYSKNYNYRGNLKLLLKDAQNYSFTGSCIY